MLSTLLDFRRQATIAKILLAPIGVGALLYWIAQKHPVATDNDAFLLVFGGLIALLSVIPFALRFREVMKVIELELSGFGAARILTQSMFYYFFIPLSVGTEVSKFAKLKNLNKNQSSSSIASAIIIDHIVGLFVLSVASIGLYLFIKPISIRIDGNTMLLIIAAGLAALTALLFFFRSRPSIDLGLIFKKLVSYKANLIFASGYSLMMLTLIAAAVAVGASYWEIEISYLDIFFVLTGAFLFQVIPLNFVGVSALEVAGTGLYMAVGLSVSESLTLVSLLYCYRILIALIGGAWEFVDACKEKA